MQSDQLRRREFREFIAGLAGAAVTWPPPAARAQKRERVRHIGVLMGYDETDTEIKALLYEFTQALSELRWTYGRNPRMAVHDRRGAA